MAGRKGGGEEEKRICWSMEKERKMEEFDFKKEEQFSKKGVGGDGVGSMRRRGEKETHEAIRTEGNS